MAYYGYTNWNRWNVAFWLYNDESLHSIVKEARDNNSSIRAAADNVLETLRDNGITYTPDGAKYSRAAVIEAIKKW